MDLTVARSRELPRRLSLRAALHFRNDSADSIKIVSNRVEIFVGGRSALDATVMAIHAPTPSEVPLGVMHDVDDARKGKLPDALVWRSVATETYQRNDHGGGLLTELQPGESGAAAFDYAVDGVKPGEWIAVVLTIERARVEDASIGRLVG